MTKTPCMDENGALMFSTPLLSKATSLVFFFVAIEADLSLLVSMTRLIRHLLIRATRSTSVSSIKMVPSMKPGHMCSSRGRNETTTVFPVASTR